MAGKQTNWQNFFSPSSGDMFSYPKCYHSSKNHRNIWDEILVPEGGGLELPLRVWENVLTFQFEIICLHVRQN